MIVISDKDRIKQVLLNLISNSYKFTFQGSITVTAALQREFENLYIKFTVKDTGIGIKDIHKSKLFKLFGTVDVNSDINPNG
jgi:signal transduction histidine kinase